jgi:hypothetical protein
MGQSVATACSHFNSSTSIFFVSFETEKKLLHCQMDFLSTLGNLEHLKKNTPVPWGGEMKDVI